MTRSNVKRAGDVEELPEGTKEYNPSIMRIRPSGQEADPAALSPRQTDGASTSAPTSPAQNGYAAGALHSAWPHALASLSPVSFEFATPV